MNTQLTPQMAASFSTFVYNVLDYAPGQAIMLDDKLRNDFSINSNHGVISGSTGIFLTKKRSGMAITAVGKSPQFKGHHVVAFRGTASLADGFTDAFVAMGINQTKQIVHGGFNKAFDSMKPQLHRYLSEHKPRCLHIMGHSLGGALANLFAAYAQNQFGMSIILYTFGAPRVGTKSFALSLNISPVIIHRITHNQDPVTIIPVWPFIHAGPEYLHMGSSSAILNVNAHMMDSYQRIISGASSYRDLAYTIPADIYGRKDVVLHYDDRFKVQCNSYWNTMIALALQSLLHSSNAHAFFMAQQSLSSIATIYDLMASSLVKIAESAEENAERVRGLVGHILVFVGRPAELITELSYTFIRRVLSYMLQKLNELAKRALRFLG